MSSDPEPVAAEAAGATDELPRAPVRTRARELGVVALAVVLTGAGHAYALRPELAGTTQMWLALGLPYVLLGALAVQRFFQDGVLLDRLMPRWGDASIGVVSTGVLLAASWAARAAVAPPDSPRHLWLLELYEQVGPSDAVQRSMALTVAVLVIASLEELTWRGLVLDTLSDVLGSRRAWLLAWLLHPLALLPTAYTMRDDFAGFNPLLPFAALGAGLVWTFLAARLGRLTPGIFAHAAFTYFSIVQFRLPGT